MTQPDRHRNREARLAYLRDYYEQYDRARRGLHPRQPAGPVAERIAACKAAGMTHRAIADAAGVSSTTIDRIMRHPDATVRQQVAERVLTVHPRWPLTTTGLTRRLRALAALGWTTTQIAEVSGLNLDTIKSYRRGEQVLVKRAAGEAIARAYDDLSMRTPPLTGRYERAAASRAKGAARRHGWAPPLAWDDAAIDDPAAQPDGAGYRPGTAAERVSELEAMGLTRDQIATRLGVRADSVNTAIQRARKEQAA